MAHRLLALVIAAALGGPLLCSTDASIAAARAPTAGGAVLAPQSPEAMATGPDGQLYVVDGGRDEVLERLADGHWKVVAGTGRRGFSGDGGPAVDADIHVGYQAGIAVGHDGTVYFSDDWNGRVRAVLADGTIETVAGGGTTVPGRAPLPARSAKFGLFGLFGLAIGPGGALYVGAGAVYRLSGGWLHWVVGSAAPALNKGFVGVEANPAAQADFAPAARLAFDGKGDLLVAGGGGWGLYERTAGGALRFLTNFRGDGYFGSLAAAPDGDVVLAGGSMGLSRFSPSGAISPLPSSGLVGVLGRHNGFRPGVGVAVAPDGTVYLDTDRGNGWTNVSAIIALAPDGTARLVWSSAPSAS